MDVAREEGADELVGPGSGCSSLSSWLLDDSGRPLSSFWEALSSGEEGAWTVRVGGRCGVDSSVGGGPEAVSVAGAIDGREASRLGRVAERPKITKEDLRRAPGGL